MTELFRAYDGVMFDLDGVIYLGGTPVPRAEDTITRLHAENVPLMYVTNNAMRSAQAAVDQLNSMGLNTNLQEVVTAAQAGVAMLTEDLPAGARVLVAGSPSLVEEVEAAGFVALDHADDRPDAVIQGYYPDANWRLLTEACLAVQHGAQWFATNDDITRPTDRGKEPGAGTQIQVVRNVCGGDPKTAGKPEKPLMVEAIRRIGAQRPLFIGDRLDTDIAGGVNVGIDTMLVFSGTHQAADLFAAVPHQRPTHIGADVADLLQPARTAVVDGLEASCGAARVRAVDGTVVIVEPGDKLDLVWATAHLVWARRDAGDELDASAAVQAGAGPY